MLEQLVLHISQYGYLAIFLLIFLQEVGVPNPIPNELVLIFSGYLSFMGTLNLFLVVLAAIAGDLLGGTILFASFYFFGKLIMKRKPKWIPLPEKMLERISNKIRISGNSGIFIGRLTPFVKGYVSVLSGLTHYAPSKYGITLLLTSIIWALAYVCCGYLAGPYWNLITRNSSAIQYLTLLIAVSVIIILILLQIFRKLLSTTK
jgi:membrane protein DedA with SNARE-associated domain